MLSFVIPAHNEETLIGATVHTLLASAEATGEEFEIIVVNDASTDRTAEIAGSFPTTVLKVNHRNIAAVRNAGAKAARGDVLVFVDADTLVPARTLSALLRAMKEGAIGGGSRVRLDGAVHWWVQALMAFLTILLGRLNVAAGCFLFARRSAFEAAGGFDSTYLVSEEVHLSRALAARGRFVILKPPVITSGRKLRFYSFWQLLKLFLRLALGGKAALQRREVLAYWYGPRN